MSSPTDPADFKPFVPAGETMREFTLQAVVVGALLGILFGASSLYLVLKVSLTVSAITEPEPEPRPSSTSPKASCW